MNTKFKRSFFLFFLFFSLPFDLLHPAENLDDNNIGHKVNHVSEQKRFVIVVASYNNELYFKENLDSIFSQNYENYHVIYTSDASTDNTFECVERYVHEHGLKKKITLINNKKNIGPLGNIHNMVHSLNNDDIVVIVDGDDFLNGPQVLKNLNAYYANPNVWLTYGRFKHLSDNRDGAPCVPFSINYLKTENIRNAPWSFSHLRTFYAGLFKRIQLKDLMKDGKFFKFAGDLASMYPMIEMAQQNTIFTNEFFYIYNDNSSINEHKKNPDAQDSFHKYITELTPYKKLEIHPKHSVEEQLTQNDQSDLIIFSDNTPLYLYACLESIEKHAKNLQRIQVIYKSTSDRLNQGYNIVKERFNSVHFFKLPRENSNKAFKRIVLQHSFNKFLSKANYITYCTDNIILTDTIKWKKAIAKIKETGAYGFFFRLGKNFTYSTYNDSPHMSYIDFHDSILSAEISKTPKTSKYSILSHNPINNLDFTLYHKSTILKDLRSLSFNNPESLESSWTEHKKNNNRLSLFFVKSKLIKIFLPHELVSNRVVIPCVTPHLPSKQNLNVNFLRGKKINIDTFDKHEFQSMEKNIDLPLIDR